MLSQEWHPASARELARGRHHAVLNVPARRPFSFVSEYSSNGNKQVMRVNASTSRMRRWFFLDIRRLQLDQVKCAPCPLPLRFFRLKVPPDDDPPGAVQRHHGMLCRAVKSV